MQHNLVLKKVAPNRLQPTRVVTQVYDILGLGVTDERKKRGWSQNVVPGKVTAENGVYQYHYKVELSTTAESSEEDLKGIARDIANAGAKWNWVVSTLDGVTYAPPATTSGGQSQGYADVVLPADWRAYFKHIYSRDPQIEIIKSCIQAAIDSNWQNRFHCVLVGEPAGGKTETALAFRDMLGSDAVLALDGPATTMAGIIRLLEGRSKMPRVVIIEEIEKSNPDQLSWLLGSLDKRAEVRKVTHSKNTTLGTEFLGIATANNYKAFKAFMDGALTSRFGEPIFFPRADDKILRRIMEREIALLDGKGGNIKGNKKWIEPTLRIAKEYGIHDPRAILKICLAGKDELLTGSYQKHLEATRMPEGYDG